MAKKKVPTALQRIGTALAKERAAATQRRLKAIDAFARSQERHYTGKKTIGVKGQRAWNAGTKTARARQWRD